MKYNRCRYGAAATVLILLVTCVALPGCKGWNPMGAGQSTSPESSVYDDPSFELPASSGSRRTSSARPGGFSKEAREIEARLGIQ